MSADVQQPCDFRMRAEKQGQTTVVTLEGELDIAAAPAVITQLRDLIASNGGTILLDVRGLTYIDSAGLGVIASMQKALAQEGRSLFAVGCHGIFEKVLRLTQLDRDVVCLPNMEEALEQAEKISASDSEGD